MLFLDLSLIEDQKELKSCFSLFSADLKVCTYINTVKTAFNFLLLNTNNLYVKRNTNLNLDKQTKA